MMTTESFPPLHSPKRTLRGRRALVYLLLRTALWMSIIIASAVYLASDALKPPPVEPPAEDVSEEPPPLPPPALHDPDESGRGRRQDQAGTLQLVQPLAAEPRAMPRSRSIPSLADSRGSFMNRPGFFRNSNLAASRPAMRREAMEGPALLEKKFIAKGVAPVSSETGKRYNPDKDAEKAREKVRRQAEAAELARKRLLKEKVKLTLLITVVATAIMILGSRVIKALRLLDEPEGPHWTLK